MKTLDHIPITKVARATKLLATGAKIGINYLNYYKDKIIESEDKARFKLNENNAEDIYDSLSKLKGSALKMLQMLSMNKSILPVQYVEKFSLSQFSVPPLSAPLVNRTFQKYFDKSPDELFDKFEENAFNAATIGQVHRAWKDGKELAVKIQYPGVAESIKSDLAIVKPIAIRMFNLKGADSEKYFREVENKLLEETDYKLELKQSQEVSNACKNIPHLDFPKYYPQWSNDRILTMDYMEGEHLTEFSAHNKNQEMANKIGQALWDFYMFQIHKLKKVQADPHPGNFLISKEGDLIAIDFGCMKIIPMSFYKPYFDLHKDEILNNPKMFRKKMVELELIRPNDSQKQINFFTDLFHEMISVFMEPLKHRVFDFTDAAFFERLYALTERFQNDTRAKRMNGNRGSKHFIYMNRTFFGLYSLLHDLNANKISVPY